MRAPTTRREALAGLATAAALGIIPSVALAKSINRSAWDKAEAHWRTVDAEYTRRCAAHDSAHEAFHDELRRSEGNWFTGGGGGLRSAFRYGIDRDEALRCATWELCQAYAVAHPGRRQTGTELKAMNAEADRIADEFMAHQERKEALSRRYLVEELERERKAYYPTFDSARYALMDVPAPDFAAAMVKVEIAFDTTEWRHEQAVLSDLRRLVGDAKGA